MFLKKSILGCVCLVSIFSLMSLSAQETKRPAYLNTTWVQESLADQLGWVQSESHFCGGFYLEQPILYPITVTNNNLVAVTSNRGLISQHGTSFLEEKVTLIRDGQEITANKAYVYRNAEGKLNAMDMIGDVHLRELNTLVIAKKGRYNFKNRRKSLIDILYRTSIHEPPLGSAIPPTKKDEPHVITTMTAWGRAYEFTQALPRVFELYRGSFSTCPPINPAWHLEAGHLVIDKNTGRGYATHARFYVKNVPIVYTPYLSFSIDKQRKSGFLWPTLGPGSNELGPYILLPFYWNMAPNYDMTITPGFLSKRGMQLNTSFRYLTHTSTGKINFSILPDDKFFQDFQEQQKRDNQNSTNQVTQAELNRLLNYNTTRKAFVWRDDSQFNEHWFTHLDFNYAGDDYYLKNFGSDLTEINENQLLQEAELYYKSEHWNFTSRVQGYQTLHPIDSTQVLNSYRRIPQFILNGDFPNLPLGFGFFINNEATHFSFLKTPGTIPTSPVGDRLHTQPGISLPMYWPYFYVNPRLQLALTTYRLHETENTITPYSINRAVPIFDVASGFYFNRETNFFHTNYYQTLEPQVYYTFIPYKNQDKIPIFDTTVNTLAYDQIFNYNRFSGIDRIGDANQLGLGITTRFIDQNSGIEKIRMGAGGIIYFANRRVTLCNSPDQCIDNPDNNSNKQAFSPLSGFLNYTVSPAWSFSTDAIFNPISKQLDNARVALHYQPDDSHILNLGYSYAHGRDILSGIQTPQAINNLKVTDISTAFPLKHNLSVLGRWSQDWNHSRLQNLLYGLQYDTCCWSVRMIGGRAFTGLDPTDDNKPKYNSQFYLQFDLKGLGSISNRDPSGTLISSINGFKPQFGQDF